MEKLKAILANYQQIALSDLDAVQLMNRTDTKFVLSTHALAEVLTEIRDSYSSLSVEGKNWSAYETLYFDTPEFEMYRLHHNGKRNRKKVRMRSYVESNLSFLEVKHKDNKGRTVKNRVIIPAIHEKLNVEDWSTLRNFAVPYEKLEAKLTNQFVRATLANHGLSERVTIDTQLTFEYEGKAIEYPNLVIIEVKQGNYDRYSQIMLALKKRLIRPASMSKYCLGIAAHQPKIKTNNFKSNLRLVQKIA